ncbi:hypothetical protein RhiirA1_484899 [Rhizophagus irregularis]|uniref:Uncharacterized protein n=1 Tax=Rhizophagus irregularis TaxID=588596 RepID=A0A2N0QIS0_9GLOM|nr:hypothetical protein RhiirA1_484899 [Rhizophagus irregularis]
MDRDQYLTDPEFSDIPIKELLSSERGLVFAEKIKEHHLASELALLDYLP